MAIALDLFLSYSSKIEFYQVPYISLKKYDLSQQSLLFTLSFDRISTAHMPLQDSLLFICLPRYYYLRSDSALWIRFGPHNYFEHVEHISHKIFANKVTLASCKILSFQTSCFNLYFTWVISRELLGFQYTLPRGFILKTASLNQDGTDGSIIA